MHDDADLVLTKVSCRFLFCKPMEDTIIKLVAIASALKMMSNMRLLILTMSLKMMTSSRKFMTARNSELTSPISISKVHWKIIWSHISFFRFLKNICGCAWTQEPVHKITTIRKFGIKELVQTKLYRIFGINRKVTGSELGHLMPNCWDQSEPKKSSAGITQFIHQYLILKSARRLQIINHCWKTTLPSK